MKVPTISGAVNFGSDRAVLLTLLLLRSSIHVYNHLFSSYTFPPSGSVEWEKLYLVFAPTQIMGVLVRIGVSVAIAACIADLQNLTR